MTGEKKLDSPDREKLLDTLVQACSWVDSCKLQCTPADHENCYGHLVNVIEPLIKDAREQERKKVLRQILRESKFLSPYELMARIKQSLKEE